MTGQEALEELEKRIDSLQSIDCKDADRQQAFGAAIDLVKILLSSMKHEININSIDPYPTPDKWIGPLDAGGQKTME